MTKKSFYIIDGHAQIYRAFFAPFRELSSPSGEPTKATFVFTQWLINLIQQQKPEYLAMTIDIGGDEGVFRRQIDPEYKANRPPRPADLPVQEERILKIVRDAGIPIFGKPGFEADDVIATMARRLRGQGWHVYMVSKDKDLRQVVNDDVVMYDMQSGDVLDAAKIATEYGYTPAQAIDVQTLMGDSTDNVRSIPGIGPKTAASLIQKYGSIPAILEHISELTPKMRENFENYKDRLPIARQLVTLKDDVEMEFDPESCRYQDGLQGPTLRAELKGLGFDTLVKKLDTNRPANAMVFTSGLFDGMEPAKLLGSAKQCAYHVVNTDELFASFISDLSKQKRIAFDTETDALGAMNSNMVGMSFSWKHEQGWYLPVRGPMGAKVLDLQKILPAIKTVLENPKIQKVGHNIKYDVLVMRRLGINVTNIAMDSMIGAFLLDAGRFNYNIDQLAKDLLNFEKIPTTSMLGSGKNQTSMDRVPLEEITRYAAEDADIALRLADMLEENLAKKPALLKLLREVEMPLVDVLVEMEFNGISIDPQMLREQSDVLATRVEDLRGRIMTAAGTTFNPDSPKQLADVLFNQLRLKPVKRTKTGKSTDVEVLEKLGEVHEVPRLILEYRSLVKLKNTYLDNLTQYVSAFDQRIHASFNQTGAATGRLSCSDPNLQNIPIRTDEGRRIRLAFVPRPGNLLLTADYSQIELRVLAHFTQEPALLKAFEADEDIHAAVASEVFGVPLADVSREQRAQAKIVNFGIIYGITAFGLSRRIEGLGVRAAEQLITDYNRRFPSISKFLQECVAAAQEQGYVETILGRRRPITEINSGVLSMRNAGERMAINSVVQGSAADLIKVAMVQVHQRLLREKSPAKLLIQVHDELVLETPENNVEATGQLVREEMEGAMKLKVPVKVEVGWGKNWGEGK